MRTTEISEVNISQYSLIGNCQSAALISSSGSIDWCCLPEFHSPAIFSALLDKEYGGFFAIHPIKSYQSNQKYILDTNVVETSFETDEGTFRLYDAYSATTEEERKHSLFPDEEILRIVEGVSGRVQVKMEFVPRIYYGKETPILENRKKLGIHFSSKDQHFILLTTLEPSEIKIENSSAYVEFNIEAGERVLFSFCYSNQGPAILQELKKTGWKRMENTMEFWRNWIKKCRYSGIYKEQVKRSALVLKLLCHAPSGAIIAAPTTSLPEEIGGVRNWDYRYCWLRDASFTIRVLIALGFEDEAHAYMNWILHATQLTRPRVQVVYSVFGHSSLKEKCLPWLKGYKNSVPIRIGNNADGQFQLDVYGEVLDALYSYSPLVDEFDHATKKFALDLGNAICKLWNKKDNGIWEVRDGCHHHTHSKAMCWVGLDRLIKISEKFNWKIKNQEKYQNIADRIRMEIEESGFNKSLESYTSKLNGDDVDSSLLTLSLAGYCSPESTRMISTCNFIYNHLSKNNLIFRYSFNDGLLGKEGSFGICNFWLAENFARSGKLEEAQNIIEAMLRRSTHTGLWSEEVDPDTDEFLGNFPQGFTHIGFINAALSIHEAQLNS